ncbi:MAG: transporter substrate-binding protein [Rhodospirillales bacterium]|nr:transporter substrate-binding protein [Rhodospirillales bacterium]
MRIGTFGAVVACALAPLAAQPAQAADKIKIGFISTLSGPAALPGIDQGNGFSLALEELGGKVGGLPAEVSKNDDQSKPDVAKQLAEKLVKRDQVDAVVGVIYSNVMMAIYNAVVDAKAIMISANAGPSQIAGKDCSPYFFATSWQNDAPHAAAGAYVQQQGVKKVVIIASNYQAGHDAAAGFKSKYKGEVIDEIYPAFGQPDYSAEITKISSEKPDAIYAFIPGGGNVPFAKQWAEAGLTKTITPYSAFMYEAVTLPAIGEAGLGVRSAAFWTYDLDNPASKKFVAAYRKKYNAYPAVYAAQAYDAVLLLDAAVKAVNGKIEDRDAFAKALATVKYDSIRGPFTFGNNHFPIQNYYATEIVKDAEGNLVQAGKGLVLKDDQDLYHDQCPLK